MKILRILLLVLSCASSLVGWAWNIYRNGVLYQFRDSHYVDVVNVFEEAGPDVIFPESIVYDGVEYTVWSLKLNRFGNDKYPYYRLTGTIGECGQCISQSIRGCLIFHLFVSLRLTI